MSAADVPARGVEPGDAPMLVHVAIVAALLSAAYDEGPRPCARVASDLVLRGMSKGTTRGELASRAEADSRRAPPERARAMRALASYLLALDEPASERRQPEAGEVVP